MYILKTKERENYFSWMNNEDVKKSIQEFAQTQGYSELSLTKIEY